MKDTLSRKKPINITIKTISQDIIHNNSFYLNRYSGTLTYVHPIQPHFIAYLLLHYITVDTHSYKYTHKEIERERDIDRDRDRERLCLEIWPRSLGGFLDLRLLINSTKF